jgi:putative oxidoreductase
LIADSIAQTHSIVDRHRHATEDPAMSDRDLVPHAALALRLGLGVMFLAHGPWLKGVVYTLPGTAAFFAAAGLPGPLAYVVFAAEAIDGVLLIAGVQVRPVSVALLPVLLGASWVHWPIGWLFTNEGGGFEYPLVPGARDRRAGAARRRGGRAAAAAPPTAAGARLRRWR